MEIQTTLATKKFSVIVTAEDIVNTVGQGLPLWIIPQGSAPKDVSYPATVGDWALHANPGTEGYPGELVVRPKTIEARRVYAQGWAIRMKNELPKVPTNMISRYLKIRGHAPYSMERWVYEWVLSNYDMPMGDYLTIAASPTPDELAQQLGYTHTMPYKRFTMALALLGYMWDVIQNHPSNKSGEEWTSPKMVAMLSYQHLVNEPLSTHQ